MKNITQPLKVIALALALSVGISYVSAWTTPSSTPPSGNVAAPVNISSTAQIKTGDFSAWNLISNGLVTNNAVVTNSIAGNTVATNNLIVATGAAAGKVLTSDATGNATWQVVAGTPGPQGPAGLQGPAGAAGPQGPTGTNTINSGLKGSFCSGGTYCNRASGAAICFTSQLVGAVAGDIVTANGTYTWTNTGGVTGWQYWTMGYSCNYGLIWLN